jgi:AraC family transcriptional regulator
MNPTFSCVRLTPGHIFGEPVRRRELSELVLTESRYQPNARLEPHEHEQANLCLVLGGSFDESFDGRNRSVRAPALLFRPRGERHSQRFSAAGGQCLTIELAEYWAERFRLPGDGTADLRGAPTLLAFRIYAGLRGADSVTPLMIEELVIELLGLASGATGRIDEGPIPGWAHHARARLHAELARPPKVVDLAAAAGVHPVYFGRRFRRAFGCSVTQYVRQLRLQVACQEMVAGEKPLSQIALDVGFSDQSHLGRAFKAGVASTPARFRSRVSGDSRRAMGRSRSSRVPEFWADQSVEHSV